MAQDWLRYHHCFSQATDWFGQPIIHHMYSICTTNGRIQHESAEASHAQLLGHICHMGLRCVAHAKTSVGALVGLVNDAHHVGQAKVYFNEYGVCVGYVLWALLGPRVEREFLAGKVRPLAAWEYNEGTSAWILDMAVAPGSLPYVLEDLRDVIFKDHEQLSYFRVKRGRRICKRVTREDASSFMAAGRATEVH